MEKIISSILLCLICFNLLAQGDSVLLVYSPKLIDKYDIYFNENDGLIKEEYTHFKQRFWLKKTEKVNKEDYVKMLLKLELNKKIVINKYNICDSLVNQIRNSASYWEMRFEIDELAREEIGYDNKEFNEIRYSDKNRINVFSEKCFDEYKTDENELKERLLSIIKSIKTKKEERFQKLNNAQLHVDSNMISSFLNTFNQCLYDFKSLEIIILQQPELFIQEINKLSDSDFFSFTLKIDNFPKTANLKKMKDSLEQTAAKNTRKKKVIRKMKKTNRN